ncbi:MULTISPECIES: DMT family transporter [Larsenimonas]|uniref:EamA family transporter n=1 Tax=Larsenimonas suaedae TaxID=1851019 RepID=A0ABU1GRC1_9GAMM|nr:EamA family transporter [Larsenimonas suaedae]MCM2972632.1 EamA family transporter [Larsenimonas suaedae]MCM5704608.1 EamA family transporter [Larsenimonas salina]MDR5894571.1 EamA family transporter [Larsenimonas suaedae]
MPFRHTLLAIGVVIVWAFNNIVIKLGVTEVPPLALTALRFLIVAVLVVPFTRLNRQQLKWVALLAFTFGLMHFGLLFIGLTYAEVGTGAILVQLGTPFATILAAIFLKERLNARRIAGLALSFAGVVVLAGGPSMPGPLALGLLVTSAMGWAVSNMIVKVGPTIPPIAMAGWMALFAVPLVSLASFLTESHQFEAIANASWRGWLAAFYSAIMSSILAYSAWYWLLRQYEVRKVIPLSLLTPVFAVLFGILLLGDHLGIYKIAGGSMIIAGIALITVRFRRRR